jgi:predicted NBD/HSP70 family sugar kinase
MRFYTKQHQAYCGIDLHARRMYVCILSQDGEMLLHRKMKTSPEMFLKAIAPSREDLVVAVECLFTGYWARL